MISNKIKRYTLRLIRFIYRKLVERRLARYGSVKVNGPCNIPRGLVSVGVNVNFNGMHIKGLGKVVIGDHFHSGEQCKIFTSSHNWEGEQLPYDSTHIIKDVSIGDYVWLGYNVLLLPGTSLGDGVIVQAGSVVHGTIAERALIGGNPARALICRDSKKYKQLVLDKKFH